MTRNEYKEMCLPYISPKLQALLEMQRQYGHKSEPYFEAFKELWEERIPHLSAHEIENIKETTKPHTQAVKGLETMAWLYDRLLYLPGETT